MNWTLEVVQVPVSDVDRAKAFYAEKVGFAVDHDTENMGDGTRFAQLTPPGSGCSIVISKGMTKLAPGAQEGLQLVVNDVRGGKVFGSTDNEAVILDVDGGAQEVPLGSKSVLAHAIWDRVVARLETSG